MALTPEDVVNKRFQPTKFREGYDQDEVDDFLDEVVVELRRLNQANEELRERLVAGESRISELQRTGGTGSDTVIPVADAEPVADELVVDDDELIVEPEPEPDTEPAIEPEPVVEPDVDTEPDTSTGSAPSVVASAPTVSAPTVTPTSSSSDIDDEAASTTNLLQLARRLHEEHVRDGIQKRDSLIAEGRASADQAVAEGESTAEKLVGDSRAEADRLVAEAQATADRLVTEAEETKRVELAKLDDERIALEATIDELRTFEREYRQKLKGYIEGQLRELDLVDGDSGSSSTGSNGQGFGGN
ncbi:DivIVA domain-containing protein [Marisediminicola senii]|uniref:DivIVA domain-containing protein n=1 Tax=Marisediminicola senii TaxID=2711233 RepID=UPI0013EB1A70|nr:DivIVA domain-containing protein [Marisediminicola senii]